MRIVGVCGFIGSGKDTIADILIKEGGFIKLSFASALKDAVSIIFGWDRVMLEGTTKESREWREKIDEWWSQRLGIPLLTPRWVLQSWGTDILRDKFHPDIWLASLERKIMSLSDKTSIVITDCRFPNEITLLKKMGAKMVQVNRPSVIKSVSIHSSEISWFGTDFDVIINNNSTLDNLREEVLNTIF
jgi:hypothetical protein